MGEERIDNFEVDDEFLEEIDSFVSKKANAKLFNKKKAAMAAIPKLVQEQFTAELKSQLKEKSEGEESSSDKEKEKPNLSKSQRMALLVIDANIKMLCNLKLISTLAQDNYDWRLSKLNPLREVIQFKRSI